MGKIIVGKWLRSLWERRGYSAGGLARVTNLSPRTISRLANGGPLSPQVAQLLSRPLHLTPQALAALLRESEVDEDEMERLVSDDRSGA